MGGRFTPLPGLPKNALWTTQATILQAMEEIDKLVTWR